MTHYDVTLKNPNVQAFLALIRWTEGAGYQTLFGGGIVDSLEDHPRIAITRTLGGKPITSTAAGAYQFLSRTWDECKKALDLPDFTAANQDRAALYLIERRRALPAVLEGDWTTALERCNREWASLPGSSYGQPTKSMAGCLAFLDKMTKGDGQSAAPFPEAVPTTTGETVMAPFVLAAIPSLIQAAPALIRLFGHGEQAEKNAKAAEIAVEIAKAVTDQPTAEGAVAAIQSDPELASHYASAIEAQWYTLTGESGGGGIAGARKADVEFQNAGASVFKSPAFIISASMLPLVYMVVGAVIFGPDWTMEIKAMVVSSIISLVLGAVSGYYLGTSFSSHRKTDMINAK